MGIAAPLQRAVWLAGLLAARHLDSQFHMSVCSTAQGLLLEDIFEPRETSLSVGFLGQQLYLQLSVTERQMFNQTGNDFVLQILSVRKSDSELRKTFAVV